MAVYWNRALQRFEGDIFNINQWTVWPTLFHIILADIFKILNILHLFSYKLEAILVLNILFSVVSVLFIFLLSEDVTKRTALSLIITLAYAFSYPLIYLNAFVLTENFAIPLIIISIWLLFRRHVLCLVLSAIVLAVAVALRPVFVLLGLAFYLYTLFSSELSKKTIIRSFIFALSFFAVIFAVIGENYYISKGKLKGLSSSGGVLFYLANSHEQIHKLGCSWDGYSYWIVPPSTSSHPENGTIKFENISINDQKFFYELGIDEIKKNPKIWVTKFIKMAQLFFGGFFPGDSSAVFYRPLMKASQVLLFLMFLFSLMGYICFKSTEFDRRKLTLLIAIALCQVSIMYFFNVEQRYVYGFSFVFYIICFLTIFLLVKNFSRFAKHLYVFLIILTIIFIVKTSINKINVITMDHTLKVTITPCFFYTNNGSLNNHLLEKTFYVNSLNFPWSEEFTHETFGKTGFDKHFFVDFEAEFAVNIAGEFEFQIFPDDAFELKIDNNLLMRRPNWETFDINKCTYFLKEGIHKMHISYYQSDGMCGIVGFYKPINNNNDGRFKIGNNSAFIKFLPYLGKAKVPKVDDINIFKDNHDINLTKIPILFFYQGWGMLSYDKTIEGNVFRIAGNEYDTFGIGTHAPSVITYNISSYGKCLFRAKFGRDQETHDIKGRVKPCVFVDGRIVFDGNDMASLTAPIDVEIPVSGNKLSLVVFGTKDGIDNDHCEWLEPTLQRIPW
jgi:hypothetical protein